MNTRTRPMAADTRTSADAGDLLSKGGHDRLRAAITTTLTENGPLTDEEIIVRYDARSGLHPAWPKLTPQRIRTARAGLVRDGLVRDAEMMAFSSLGNRATAWTLT